jgi:hypothetical protein
VEKPTRKSQTAAVTVRPVKDSRERDKPQRSAGQVATAISEKRNRGKTPITPEFVENSGSSETDHPIEPQKTESDEEGRQLPLDESIRTQIEDEERMQQDLL